VYVRTEAIPKLPKSIKLFDVEIIATDIDMELHTYYIPATNTILLETPVGHQGHNTNE
jgi:hypothetical protein